MSSVKHKGRVVALVPMRHGSERAPGKNHRAFLGRPLCGWVIEALQGSGVIDEIVVDTDSAPVREICEGYGGGVRVIDRPEHLAGGHVSMNDVIAHDLEHLDAAIIVQTHSTNPLLRASTIATGVRLFREHAATHDCLFSVTRHQKRFYSPDGVAVNHDPERLLRTQDLEPYFEENSCLYVFTPSGFCAAGGSRIGVRPLMLEMDPVESMDIDTERDFVITEGFATEGAREAMRDPRLVNATSIASGSAA